MRTSHFLAASLFLFTAACHAVKQPLTLIPVNQSAPVDEQLKEEDLLPPLSGEFAYDNSPEIRAAMKEYSVSGKAPIVKRAGFVEFPFGEVQPILNCQPNYGCDIELEAGEHVKAVILGNEPLWDYLIWESNQQFEPIQHVTIGPRVSQAQTNAIIGTDRRTYHLELLSTTQSEYIRSAKFYYPRERLREFQTRQREQNKNDAKTAALEKRKRAIDEIASKGTLPYEYMSFGWEITAESSVSWNPIRVFDDGAHIYIQFPEQITFDDFPGIYAPLNDGKLTQPVWRTVQPEKGKSRETGTYIMVDGMFDELRLVGGFSDEQQTVVIKKKKQP